MGLVIEQPESMEGGGNFIDKPGVYHMLVTAVDENPVDKDEDPLDGLKVTLAVLDGSNVEQKDRSIDLMLWKPTEKDSMASKKQTAFCLATCLIGAHKPGQKTTVEPQDAVGRQVVAKLAWRQKKNDAGKYEDTDRVDLNYSDIWHVDDPNVAKNKARMNQEALAMIPAALRKLTAQPEPSQLKVSAASLISGTRSATPAASSLSDL